MNELERFFRHLAGHLATSSPDSLRGGHTLGALLVEGFPYRVARRRLAIECSEDYEMMMMRLAAGEGGYLELADPKAVETLRQELSGVNPDLTLLAVFGDMEVHFSPLAVSRAMGQPDDADYRPVADRETEDTEVDPEEQTTEELAQQPSAAEPQAAEPEEGPPVSEIGDHTTGDEPDLAAPAGGPPPPPPLPFATGPIAPAQHSPEGTSCGACGAELPPGRPIRFCPHCGRNLLGLHCASCRAELEPGWRHCVECGATVAGSAPPPAR